MLATTSPYMTGAAPASATHSPAATLPGSEQGNECLRHLLRGGAGRARLADVFRELAAALDVRIAAAKTDRERDALGVVRGRLTFLDRELRAMRRCRRAS